MGLSSPHSHLQVIWFMTASVVTQSKANPPDRGLNQHSASEAAFSWLVSGVEPATSGSDVICYNS